MNATEARAALKAVQNLNEFSRNSKIPRRTLSRILAAEGPIRVTTLKLLSAELKRLKPETKPTQAGEEKKV